MGSISKGAVCECKVSRLLNQILFLKFYFFPRRSQLHLTLLIPSSDLSFRFLVKASHDYTPQLLNPDIPLEWSQILQIILPFPTTCPICLTPEPIVPRITKCGHVYCLSCILHYLELSDKKWRKCPICYESIYESDLKSIHVIDSHLSLTCSSNSSLVIRGVVDEWGIEQSGEFSMTLMQRSMVIIVNNFHSFNSNSFFFLLSEK